MVDKIIGASFSENFYGMKRVNPSTNKTPMGGDRLKTLFFISVWPYLRGKLDELQARLGEVAEERVCRWQITDVLYVLNFREHQWLNSF